MEEQNQKPIHESQNDSNDSTQKEGEPNQDSSSFETSLQVIPNDEALFEEEGELLPIPLEILEAEIAREEVDTLYAKNKEANKVVLSFSAAAAATGALPIPLADAPVLIAEQIAMLAKISEIYHINLKRNGLKSLVFTALGVSGTTVLGKTITGSLLKMIPGLGSIGGAAVNGTTAATLTAALGTAYCELCQKVFLGELDEKLLLGYEGKNLLKTSFKNHLRLGFQGKESSDSDKDVLQTHPIPSEEDVISMEPKEDLDPSLKEDDEPLEEFIAREKENIPEDKQEEFQTVTSHLDGLADLIQATINQDSNSKTESDKPEEDEKETDASLEKPTQSSSFIRQLKDTFLPQKDLEKQEQIELDDSKKESSPLEDSLGQKEENEMSDQVSISTTSIPSYSEEDIARLVNLYTSDSKQENQKEDHLEKEIGFSFPDSKIQK